MATIRFKLTIRHPLVTFGNFLEVQARERQILDPRGHHLSAEEIAQHRRNGVGVERVCAVLYSDVDCPRVDCRGHCKLMNQSSQVHEAQQHSTTANQELLQAPSIVQETPGTIVEQASQGRKTSEDQPTVPSISVPSQLPTTTIAKATSEADCKALSRAREKAFQKKFAQGLLIARRANIKRMESDVRKCGIRRTKSDSGHVTFC